MTETENEIEFKELVKSKLEKNGLLVNLKAQLRAQIYNLLENDQDVENPQATPSKLIDSLENSLATEEENKTFKKETINQDKLNLLKSDECSLALYLVEDFLDALNLNFTKSVFRSEIGSASKNLNKSKDEVLNELNLMQCGFYNCNGGTGNDNDNESSLNSSSSTTHKKFNKDHPILLQLLNNKFSPNNSDVDHKMNVTYNNTEN